ncbi:MAG: HNH endonuclease [Clostridia bacterium]|nr:HNH endonuclease [Clostridia bacterium]
MEQWKNIKGYEGFYQVSDLGRVKSLKYGKERVLVGIKDTHGYLMVRLCKDSKAKTCKVHRLVADAFIPNPNNLPQVNHKDENKGNNVVTNLEWCDAGYNTNYGTRNERSAKARTNHPNKSKPVYQYTMDGTLIKSYPSTMEVERQTGYGNSKISECCLGKHKQAYGFIWSYALIVVKGKLF